MEFYRVNKHTIRCKLNETEIEKMGYHIQEIFQNQEVTTNFLKDIYSKACDEGYNIGESYMAVQSIFLPNHQLILSFSDCEKLDPVDQTLQGYITIYDVLEQIGKDRLVEILNMPEEEKVEAFNEITKQLLEAQQQMTDQQNELENDSEEEEEEENLKDSEEDCTEEEDESKEASQDETVKKTIHTRVVKDYILSFSQFDQVERFCKAIPLLLPGALYKDHNKYVLTAYTEGLEKKQVNEFIYQAHEFASDVNIDKGNSAYLDEFGEVLIKENAMAVLSQL